MSAPRDQIVDAARQWLGTPYVHQASAHRAGCDCLGLVRGVWRMVVGQEPCTVPPYSFDWNEAQGHEGLWQGAQEHLRMAAQPQIGQVLLFRMREDTVAKHMGIQTALGPDPKFIHAYARSGVVEVPLSWPWQRRLAARFEFPINIEV